MVTTVANFGIALLVAGSSTTLAGVFFATTAIVTIAGNSSALGTMTGLVYFMPSVLAADRANPRSLLWLAGKPVVVVSTTIALALALGSGSIAGIIADGEGHEVAGVLLVLAPAVPFWAVTVAALGATRGLGSMTPTVLINQVVRPLGQFALIATVVLGDPSPSATAIAVAWLAPVVVTAALAAAAVAILGGLRADGPALVGRTEFWTYTRPRAVSAAGQIALERSDVILVSALAGAGAAGVYGTVTRFVTAGNFVVFAMGQASSSPLRRALAAGRTDEAQRLLDRATAWMVLAAGSYFLLVATKASALVAVLGPDLTAGAGALTIASLAMVVNAAAGPVDLTLLMLGRSRASLAATAGALVIDLAIAVATIPWLGLAGAALAWGAAVVVQNVVAAVLVNRHGGLRPFGPPARRALAVASVAVLPAGLLTADTFGGLVAACVVSGGLLVALAMAQAGTFGLPGLGSVRGLGRSS
ncbi:MAG: polysaccharide biosynthesis C-terminal domain-containing protein [Actinomycetota bacterium]